MRRRDLVAWLIFGPLLILTLLGAAFPEAREIALGYILAASLAFKGAILSFYSASKLKLLAFFKGLTLLQGSLLLLKRWFLDNVFSRWLRRNILEPVSGALREAREYYLGLHLRLKIKNLLLALGVSALSLWLLYSSGYLGHLFLFTELKVIVISLSKTVLLVVGKMAGVLFNSWITPILEVFAFSWFFAWLERTLGPEHPVNRFLRWLGRIFGLLFARLLLLFRRTVDPLLNDRIREQSRRIAERAADYIRDRKVAYELEQFDRFEGLILGAHIDAYHHIEGMERIRDKRRLYALINRETRDDGIEIVAFVSRNARGELLPEEADDSFYHDVFLLEGLASSQRRGVHRELDGRPDASDFWILNTSLYPATLRSHSGIIPPTPIEAQSLRLIETSRPVDYRDGDLYLEYQGRTEAFIPVEHTA
ncbi:hypothetical protein [Nitratifractor sp.]